MTDRSMVGAFERFMIMADVERGDFDPMDYKRLKASFIAGLQLGISLQTVDVDKAVALADQWADEIDAFWADT
jgi:hypothetical protein